jgi:hypothetical protein
MKKIGTILFILLHLSVFSQTEQWSREIFYTQKTYVGGVGIDASNNIYVSGSFRAGAHESPSTSYKGFFRIKYDPAGNIIWMDTTRLKAGYGGSSYYVTMACDQSGNNYTGGNCSRTFNMDGVTINLPASSSSNGFFAKTNSAGAVIWGKGFYRAAPVSISYASVNAIYVCGRASVPILIDGQSVPAGGFIAKFDSSGLCRKVIHTGSTKVMFSTTDSLGNLYVQAGEATNPQYIYKYDSNDSLLWSKSIGSGIMLGITADKAGNIYYTQSPYSGSYTRKLDTNGNLVWMKANTVYYPDGIPYHETNSAVYYSIAIRNDSIKESYLVTYSDADGSAISYLPLTLLPGYEQYRNTKIITDNEDNLVVAGELNEQYDKVSVKKFGFSPVAGVQENNYSSGFSVYPNPSHGLFRISYFTADKISLQLNINDSRGKCVYSERVSEMQGEFNCEIDMSRYAKGIYTIEIIADNKKRQVKKVIVN